MKYEADFLKVLFQVHPELQGTGAVSRQQIITAMEAMNSTKWPWFIMKNKVGRGVYALPGVNVAAAGPANVPVKIASAPVEAAVVEQIASVATLDESALVPRKSETYVPFGIHKDVDTIVKSKMFYPVYIAGPTGNGKSTAVEQVCAKAGRGMIRVNLNAITDEDALIGSKTLEDGNVKIVEGPVIIAMRLGIPLLLDEIDAGGANTLLCLQQILEGGSYFFKLKNELVIPKKGFNIFATANTKGKGSEDGRYIGTNILNEAFLERFAVTLNQEYPTPTVERKIIINLMQSLECVDEQFAETLVKWADSIRKTHSEGAVDETITTRRLVHIIKAFSIFKDKKKAIELATNRFDSIVQNAFITLFEGLDASDSTPSTPTPADEITDSI